MSGRPSARGEVVVIAGPDGAGKSTLAAALAASLDGTPVRRFHHRIGSLPRRAASLVPTERPHAQVPYPRWLSGLKVVYLYADHLIGWVIRVRPTVRRRSWVILERGWWDLVVDPTRYRLSGVDGLARRLGRWLPRPDLLVVLDAPASTLVERKPELPAAEVGRQSSVWRELASDQRPSLVLDARREVPELVAAILTALGRTVAPPTPPAEGRP